MNAIICNHKESRYIRACHRITIEGEGFKLQIGFKLYPYGLGEDAGKFATLEADIYFPCPCRGWGIANKSHKLNLVIRVVDPQKSSKMGEENGECELDKKSFRTHKLIPHMSIIHSRSVALEVTVTASLIGPSEQVEWIIDNDGYVILTKVSSRQ